MSTDSVTTKDGVQIFYKDRGSGTPIVFSHGMPTTHAEIINADILSYIRG